ncbi:MAG TPA: hypothetical protein PLL99_07845, partial [Chitinophagales bacterium]|nr:hypothetical protein [Chitinophagales bacterium]
MEFDKNTVIGITLIILIFLGFSIYTQQEEAKFKKEHPQQEQAAKYPADNTKKDSTATNTPIATTEKQAIDSVS